MQRSQSWIIPTVMSPEKGGPVYNQLRANFAYTRRMIQRHPFRWIHDNWDFERQALVNVPEPNLEIRKNQWMHFVDAAYWDGIVGRVFQDFMIYMLGYPALAWLLYAMWWRFKLNDMQDSSDLFSQTMQPMLCAQGKTAANSSSLAFRHPK